MSLDQVLTRRELEICGLIAKGLSSRQIAKQLFLSHGTVRNYITSIYEKTGVQNKTKLAVKYISEYAQAVTDVSEPLMDTDSSKQPDAIFRLVGLSGLPERIPITLEGRPFIIGRFDVSIGHRQHDFEFGKATKAVSRRHASVERAARGCVITDLNSSAGTYVNGTRIKPDEAYPIKPGDRVSFGSAGADYVFELFNKS